jgi:hypothetical protein
MVTTLEDLRARQDPAGDGAGPQPPASPPPTLQSRPAGAPQARRHRLSVEGTFSFVVPVIAYLAFAYVLAFRWHSYFPDAQSRLANGFYVIYSRDPHLAAVGFVWQPFTSLASIPLLLFKGLWPALVHNFFAANIQSAFLGALAVHHARKTMLESGVATAPRLVFTALFAFNPMFFYYGSNGMSEAGYLCFLIIGVRYLVRWLDSERPVDLAVAGIGVGMAYMVRNEAALGAALATLAVFFVSWRRAPQSFRNKFHTAATDAAIFVLPFTVCFVGWAVTSWIIVGHPFEQLQGTYGTASMISAGANVFKGSPDYERQLPHHVLHDVLALGPLLPALLLVALILILRPKRRDYRPLAPIAILGGGLLFSMATAITHKTGGFLRYYICAVPLSILLSAALAARRPELPGRNAFRQWWYNRTAKRWNPKVGMSVLSVLAVVSAIPTIATTWTVLHSGIYASEEFSLLLPYFRRGQPIANAPSRYYNTALSVAQHIDALKLRNGSVLVDNSDACVPFIILLSAHPTQFIIPNDRDFQKTVSDPVGFDVKYVLSVPNSGLGQLDAINRSYSTFYNDGQGIATLYENLGGGACPNFKLYKVNALAP